MTRLLLIPDLDAFHVESDARISTSLRWANAGAASAVSAESWQTGTLAEMGGANDCVAVIPATRIAFIDALLPPVSKQKRDQLVNFAIEDKLTIDPSTIHAVVLGNASTGVNRYVIAAIERAWLNDVLAWLAQAGIRPSIAVAESALYATSPEEWLVILDATHGNAIRHDGLCYSVDVDQLAEPPFALMLALNEVAAAQSSNASPKRLRIRADASIANNIDRARWQASLGASHELVFETDESQSRKSHIHDAANDIGNNIVGRITNRITNLNPANLLVGTFRPASTNANWITASKPAWMLGFLVLALHIVFVSMEAWQLSRTRVAIETEMRQLFLTSFPSATTIVDPALQMTRNLEQLKRERGVASDPVQSQLARAAVVTEDVRANVSGARFESRLLSIRLAALTDAQREQLNAAIKREPNASLTLDKENTIVQISNEVAP